MDHKLLSQCLSLCITNQVKNESRKSTTLTNYNKQCSIQLKSTKSPTAKIKNFISKQLNKFEKQNNNKEKSRVSLFVIDLYRSKSTHHRSITYSKQKKRSRAVKDFSDSVRGYRKWRMKPYTKTILCSKVINCI